MKKKIMVLGISIIGASIGLSSIAEANIINKCKACHNFTAKKKVGPGWGPGDTGKGVQRGVFGRVAGSSPGFKYKFTKYIKGEAWSWDEAHLRKWMCNSRNAVKEFTRDKKAKTKMPPQRVCKIADQDKILAFMKSLDKQVEKKDSKEVEKVEDKNS